MSERGASAGRQRRLSVTGNTLGTTVGYAPAALAIHRPWVILAFLVGSMLVAVPRVSRKRTPSRIRGSASELALATFDTMVIPVFVGLLWLAFYAAVYWVVRQTSGPGGHQAHASLVALAVSGIPVGALAAGMVVQSVDELGTRLFPERGGTRTFYRYVAPHPGRLVATDLVILAIGVTAAVLAAVFAGGAVQLALWLSLLGIFLGVGGTAQPPSTTASNEGAPDASVKAIGSAFEVLGYTVEYGPKSDRDDIDPLLRELHLRAAGPSHDYAVSLAVGSKPLDWTTGSPVLNGARALESIADPHRRVLPLLAVMFATPDSTLKSFCESEGVSLLDLSATGDVDVIGEFSSELVELGDIWRKSLTADGPEASKPGRQRSK